MVFFTVPHPSIKAHPLSFRLFSFTKGSYYTIEVKCQPFLKCSGYYVADLTPLNLTDSSLETLLVFALFQVISIQKT